MIPHLPLSHLETFGLLDAVAVALLVAGFFAIGWRIEHPASATPSVTVLMAEYRREWMVQMVTRQPRIFDAAVLASLRQGTSFFASTCVIAIGGVLALVGNAERLANVAEELALGGAPTLVWQVKLIAVALFLTNGFLKFVWANRLFGYCAVVMASVPNDVSDALAYPRAARAAELNIRAAWNFNAGLRSMYFALGAVAWLAGPAALIAATLGTLWLLWTREFRSRARSALIDAVPRATAPSDPDRGRAP